MQTRSYIPKTRLSNYVDCIWVSKAQELTLQSSHHAAMFTELIFNYGDSFEMIGQTVNSTQKNHSQQLLSGLKTRPFQTNVSGTHACVGLILKPFCYSKLLYQLDTSIIGQLSEILYLNLYEPMEPNFKTVEPYLLELFSGLTLDKDLIHFENYLSKWLQGTVDRLGYSRALSMSQKSFIQKFKKYYVLTPGQYTKLKQVNHALSLLKTPNKKLVEVGLEAGFYDQSHFIRVFKHYCGSTPKSYQKRNLG